LNPNGILSISPRLRGTSYLGKTELAKFNVHVPDFLLAVGPTPQHVLPKQKSTDPKKIYEKHKSYDAEMGRLLCCYAGCRFNNRLSIGQGAGSSKYKVLSRCRAGHTGGRSRSRGRAGSTPNSGTGRHTGCSGRARRRRPGCNRRFFDPAGSHQSRCH
jgi:hypothetical protein